MARFRAFIICDLLSFFAKILLALQMDLLMMGERFNGD
jgi:hypothetical protein